MKESVPDAKKRQSRLPPALFRWLFRIAVAAAILSLVGWFSRQSVSPLMCKIYG